MITLLLLICRPIKKVLGTISIYITFVALLTCLVMYIIKTGGIPASAESFLVLVKPIHDFLRFYPVSINRLSFLISVFRSILPCLLLINSIRTVWFSGRFFHGRPWFYALIFVPCLIVVYFSFPQIYLSVFSFNFGLQKWFSTAVYTLLTAYCVTALVFYGIELHQIRLSWHKKVVKYLLVANLSLTAIFLLLAYIDPLELLQDYIGIRLKSYYYLFTSKLDLVNLSFFAFGIMFAMSINLFAMWKYVMADYDKDKLELTIKKNIDSASLITAGFIHGIKNQVLSARILSNKIYSASQQNDIEKVFETSERLTQINQEILDRLDYLYKSFKEIKAVLIPIEFSEIVVGIKVRLGQRLEEVLVSFDIAEGVIMADKSLLEEAFCNILLNSIESVEKKKNAKIQFSFFFTRVFATVRISDNGCGIPTELKNKIFLPFSTSKNASTNWGLGLCYAKQVIKKHFGDIRFETKTGEGTIFYIMLPKYSAKGR